jgi:superoxide reductase
MTRLREIYLCTVCGNVTEVLAKGNRTLSCCGKPMEKLKEKNLELGHEKHLPVVEKSSGGLNVRVGEAPHPMTEEHHIVFIEALTDEKVYRAELLLDSSPEAEFCTGRESIREVRAYCNLHGLWSREL